MSPLVLLMLGISCTGVLVAQLADRTPLDIQAGDQITAIVVHPDTGAELSRSEPFLVR